MAHSRKSSSLIKQTSKPILPCKFRLNVLPIPLIAMIAGFTMIPWADDVWNVLYHFLRALPIEDFLHTGNQWATEGVVITLLATIWFLDPAKRKYLGVLLIAILINSTVVETTKQITGRARPTYGVRMGEEEKAELEQFIELNPGTKVSTEATDQWMWLDFPRPIFDHDFSSFPSGHAAGGFVISAFLALLYPRGRWIWYILAILCAAARVEKRRHYPSDVFVGAGLGFLIANIVYSSPWAVRMGAKFEPLMHYLYQKTIDGRHRMRR